MGWEYDNTNNFGEAPGEFDKSRPRDIRDLPQSHLEIVQPTTTEQCPAFIPGMKIPLPGQPKPPSRNWLN